MKARALVVDDEPAICELLGKVLTSTGMQALVLTKSSEASRHFDKEKFDMAFLDFHMPAPDGLELARRMRLSRWNRATPIILISDDQRPSAMALGFEAGASAFLYKPIDKDRLLKLIQATQGIVEYGRRQSRRFVLQLRVTLRHGAEELQGETVNVSLTGLLVKVAHTLPKGSLVQLSMDVSPRFKPVIASGSVVRVEGENQMGIQLDQLAVAESAKLQEFLLARLPAE